MNLEITSTATKIHVVTNDMSDMFGHVIETSFMRSSIVKVELVRNTTIGDYITVYLNVGQDFQLQHGAISSVNGDSNIPDIETMYALIDDIL